MTDDDTTVAPPSPATLRRGNMKSLLPFMIPDTLEVQARDLLRSALETDDPGLRKLNCSLLKRQHHLTRWWNREHGALIGEDAHDPS